MTWSGQPAFRARNAATGLCACGRPRTGPFKKCEACRATQRRYDQAKAGGFRGFLECCMASGSHRAECKRRRAA
jgi:hypothetical protein